VPHELNHASVFTPRSSNRMCGFPASGSRRKVHVFAHGRLLVRLVRPLLSVRLGYPHPQYGLRLIRSTFQLLRQFVQQLIRKTMRKTNCGRSRVFLLGGFCDSGPGHLLTDASQHCLRRFFPMFLLRHAQSWQSIGGNYCSI
jgi:hypothetical protein